MQFFTHTHTTPHPLRADQGSGTGGGVSKLPLPLSPGLCGYALDTYVHCVFNSSEDVEWRLVVELIIAIVVLILEVILTNVDFFVFTTQANDGLSAVYTSLREGPTDGITWCF